ncbi:hypothetical protein XAP6164_350008 [Xanthomonas phaseoli pv. phaseoli]|nr:hypothetical protein XAP6164_350008 [Xanthomonas phaseoli pv. phaseoli]
MLGQRTRIGQSEDGYRLGLVDSGKEVGQS